MIKVLVSIYTHKYYILVSFSIVTACSRAIFNILSNILCFKKKTSYHTYSIFCCFLKWKMSKRDIQVPKKTDNCKITALK